MIAPHSHQPSLSLFSSTTTVGEPISTKPIASQPHYPSPIVITSCTLQLSPYPLTSTPSATLPLLGASCQPSQQPHGLSSIATVKASHCPDLTHAASNDSLVCAPKTPVNHQLLFPLLPLR
ncbi:hypothetical protein OIU79_022222 [Salix purpurea]|uniref:Uncharacterized protein n=1 Tax=Salix purpurea TaxID=77065 RepID=A0A9Q1ACN5_SALPP|nr:hypothetical protein OIU79_022222 [Salix purpurea]